MPDFGPGCRQQPVWNTIDSARIVLVHGGFVDGSGWEAVYRALRDDGYKVSIGQNPKISLVEAVRATIRVIYALDGPVVLVGHSYGGVVIPGAMRVAAPERGPLSATKATIRGEKDEALATVRRVNCQ